LPLDLDDLILLALAADPAARISRARELGDALRGF
jgi:hypothetical protein